MGHGAWGRAEGRGGGAGILPAASAILLLAAVTNGAEFNTTLKLTGLGSRAPDDETLYPDRSSGVGLTRLRFGMTAGYDDLLNAGLAYEHYARVTTGEAGEPTGAGFLPSNDEAPYRIRQLDWEIDGGHEDFSWRHEIDRAFVALHPRWGEITLGRQAIGLGRGALFGAIDVFAPFAPTEVDREWRRGVDAARAEYRFADTGSAEIIGAFAEESEDSAVLGRVRGYYGKLDAELVAGRRGDDHMYGGSVSAAVGDSEAHLEAALFETREDQPDGGAFGHSNLVFKGVLGASHTFDVGDGLTVLAEYHYSGFGVRDIGDAAGLFTNEVFASRYLGGDTQILGRHALALQVHYPFTASLTGNMLVMQSPVDGSGIAGPSLVWDAAESTSIVLSGFAPWGDKPCDGRMLSEYGGAPVSLILQISLYY